MLQACDSTGCRRERLRAREVRKANEATSLVSGCGRAGRHGHAGGDGPALVRGGGHQGDNQDQGHLLQQLLRGDEGAEALGEQGSRQGGGAPARHHHLDPLRGVRRAGPGPGLQDRRPLDLAVRDPERPGQRRHPADRRPDRHHQRRLGAPGRPARLGRGRPDRELRQVARGGRHRLRPPHLGRQPDLLRELHKRPGRHAARQGTGRAARRRGTCRPPRSWSCTAR